LLQFLYAADRGNSRLAGRYDSLSPALLRLLHFVVEKTRPPVSTSPCVARWRGRPVERWRCSRSVCAPCRWRRARSDPVKAMVRSLDLQEAAGFVASVLTQPDRPLRETLRLFAVDHAIEI
jgi:phosphotransferase system enzyme I (PtsP)